MQLALLLIALGFGFKIYAEANTNPKKLVKQIGRFVGISMMLISFATSLTIVSYMVKYGCPMGKDGGWGKMCPFTGKPLMQTEMTK